jgi:hypothetical protein
MKKLTLVLLIGVAMALAILACKKVSNGPLSTDKTKPGPVTNPQVQNLHGAALITYTLPDNSNLLYVKAEYTVKGVKRQSKSSQYTNKILVEGFADTLATEVSLYAVTRAEVASDAVKVTVKPLTPSILVVRASLVLDSTFGGISVKYSNPDTANIAIGVVIKDSAGDWKQVDYFYTSQKQGTFAVRGFPPVPREWGVFVRDRWLNYSDTLKQTWTPIYEIELDKTKFKDARAKQNDSTQVPQFLPLPGSGNPMKTAQDYSSSWVITKFWDGSGMGTSGTNGFHTKEKFDQPIWIPILLDQTNSSVKFALSRYKIWQRTGGFVFNHGNPHSWEIWGTNDLTKYKNLDLSNTDPNKGWVLLDKRTMVKPSGRDVGDNTAEDIQVATDGQEYEFPAGIPAVRYIAWKNIDSWGSIGNYTGHMHLMEISIWGQKR